MGLASELDGQKIRPRVETDHELRALTLDRLGQAVGEVRRRDSGHSLRVLRPKETKAPLAGADLEEDDEGRDDAAFVSSLERLETRRLPRRP